MYDTEQDKRINKFVKACKKKKQNYAYLRVWTVARNTLTEKNEKFVFESVVERPFRGDWDSFGGSCGSGQTVDRHDIDGIKKVILDFHMNQMKKPYISSKEKEALKEDWFRDILDENIKAFYSGPAYIWLGKEAFDDINNNIEKLKGNNATDEHKKIAKRETEIESIVENMKKEVREYDKAMDAMNEEETEYSKIEPYMKQVYIGKQMIFKLETEHKKIRERLRDIIRGE